MSNQSSLVPLGGKDVVATIRPDDAADVSAELTLTASAFAVARSGQPYIFEWCTGDFHLVGPFFSDDAACGWARARADKTDNPRWQLMHLEPESLDQFPILEFVGPESADILSILNLCIPDLRLRAIAEERGGEYPHLTLRALASTPLFPNRLDFYVLVWADDRIKFVGPFAQPAKASEWGHRWQANNEDNPCWEITAFYGKTLAEPVRVRAPAEAIYTLYGIRASYTAA